MLACPPTEGEHMGVRLLTGTYDGTQHGATVMVDSVSGTAFGPVFDSWDDAEDFREWAGQDPRTYTPAQLHAAVRAWHESRVQA
jgi:hypothetical protein